MPPAFENAKAQLQFRCCRGECGGDAGRQRAQFRQPAIFHTPKERESYVQILRGYRPAAGCRRCGTGGVSDRRSSVLIGPQSEE